MTIPWMLRPKGTYDQLLDILILGPAILEKGDYIESLPPQETLPAVMGVIEQCMMVYLKLEAFYRHLEDTLTQPLYWEVPTAKKTPEEYNSPAKEPSNFPVNVFKFQDLDAARIIMLYWATYCLLLAGVCDLYNSLEQQGILTWIVHCASPDAMAMLDKRHEWIEMARNVCRSTEYCSLSDTSGAGALRLASPLDLVSKINRSISN